MSYGVKIDPGTITQPIHVLGAFLAALVIIVGEFLWAATRPYPYAQLNLLFAFCAPLFILIFLIVVFLLLTKYRREMQGDEHYSKSMQIIWGLQIKGPKTSYSQLKGEKEK